MPDSTPTDLPPLERAQRVFVDRLPGMLSPRPYSSSAIAVQLLADLTAAGIHLVTEGHAVIGLTGFRHKCSHGSAASDVVSADPPAPSGDVPKLLQAVRAMCDLPSRLSQETIDRLPSVWWDRHDALVEAFEPFADEVGR